MEAGAARPSVCDGRCVPYLSRRWGGAADFTVFVPWVYGIRAFHVLAVVTGERLCLTFLDLFSNVYYVERPRPICGLVYVDYGYFG